jgi:hypothetical protein
MEIAFSVAVERLSKGKKLNCLGRAKNMLERTKNCLGKGKNRSASPKNKLGSIQKHSF